MISVKSITINKFRAFHPGECFELGRGVTLIAGLNGTSKSTLLGMICQPIGFPTTDKKSIYTDAYKDVSIKDKRTLFGSQFKTAISDVFRFSKVHDKPREHDYVVRLEADAGLLSEELLSNGLKVRSEARGGAESNKIRIVTNSEIRDPGSGNFPHPVIYLGLDRLRPLSTVDTVRMETSSQLTDEEKRIWHSLYSEVMLCAPSENIASGLLDTDKGGKRRYESVNASNYDGESASAGQDNLTQLITAILSFYRLKTELGDKYQGGILLVDELDATLHPFSQQMLLQRLIKYAESLKIQIVATTHSLFLLRLASRQYRKAVCLLFLERNDDGMVHVSHNLTYEEIEHKLALVASERHIKEPNSIIPILFEDDVAALFFKAITKNVFKDYIRVYNVADRGSNVSLSNNTLASIAKYIASKKIPEFSNVVYVLDGDSKNLLNEKTRNLVCLPGDVCAEHELYTLFHQNGVEERQRIAKIGITWQECFQGYADIANDPTLSTPKAKKGAYKKWFAANRDKGNWGRACAKVFNIWRDAHLADCQAFCEKFLMALTSIDKTISHSTQAIIRAKFCMPGVDAAGVQ